MATASVFLWLGFVGAISFMEAWLKFRAPGVTLPIGLGIGRLVFAALNKVEWVLWLVAFGSLLYKSRRLTAELRNLLLVWVVLMIQSILLLPGLDARAEMYIQGINPPASYLHVYYVIAEGVKVILLLMTGITLLKRWHTQVAQSIRPEVQS